jgi:hypothetical protein
MIGGRVFSIRRMNQGGCRALQRHLIIKKSTNNRSIFDMHAYRYKKASETVYVSSSTRGFEPVAGIFRIIGGANNFFD